MLPREIIVYTLSFTNRVELSANNVVLTEVVPTNTTFNAGARSAGWSCATGSPAGMILGTLAANRGSGQVDFAITLDSPLDARVTQIAKRVTVGDDGSNGGDLNLC
ncbi:MAG: DUF11 domain-containing protein [Blastochloris sp.]|nr:DUF11 domain-containing protein [Blastochloris sp.]